MYDEGFSQNYFLEVLVIASSFANNIYKNVFSGGLKFSIQPSSYNNTARVIYQTDTNYVKFGNVIGQLFDGSLKVTITNREVIFKIFVLKIKLI